MIHISKCNEGIVFFGKSFQRVGGWCEPIRCEEDLSFRSRAAERFE